MLENRRGQHIGELRRCARKQANGHSANVVDPCDDVQRLRSRGGLGVVQDDHSVTRLISKSPQQSTFCMHVLVAGALVEWLCKLGFDGGMA